jgi:DNA-directed RNA polymerase subunit RPC12/RpoP
MIIKKFNESLNETYYKCECGSDTFIRVYNVWNEIIKVKVTEENGEEFWDVEELGKEKDHLYGYMCAECRKDNAELNDGL